MAVGRPKATLTLSNEEPEILERWARRRKSSQALALRSRIVIECGQGLDNKSVAARLKVTMPTVGKWRKRFIERRLDGLLDELRPGAPRKISDANVERVVTQTLETKPTNATHWSTRSMAKASGLSQTAVSRIWRAFALQPHRSETFKLSTNPPFVDKLRDIVGLYMSPLENAIVLCVDEKSQVQAIDRIQLLLPIEPGRPERYAHYYKHHGTTTLIAALNLATGHINGASHQRHRLKEFVKFLDQIDQSIPETTGETIHIVMDNFATHKTPRVQRWLARRLRYQNLFTPTSASGLNQVERVFAEITKKRIRRSAFRSRPVPEKSHSLVLRSTQRKSQAIQLGGRC